MLKSFDANENNKYCMPNPLSKSGLIIPITEDIRNMPQNVPISNDMFSENIENDDFIVEMA